ncbi:MAG: PEP-CTERM sorting domain-containing protein [Planctomycetota bacterium]|nr:PEP-CTERM sorting domain-containing protein [Planctomycetota bacterium]
MKFRSAWSVLVAAGVVGVLAGPGRGATANPGDLTVTEYWNTRVMLAPSGGNPNPAPYTASAFASQGLSYRAQELAWDTSGTHLYVLKAGNSQSNPAAIVRYTRTGAFDGYFLGPYATAGIPSGAALCISGNSLFLVGADSLDTKGIALEYDLSMSDPNGAPKSVVVNKAFDRAVGITASPVTGHVFVSSSATNNVYEYARSGDAWEQVGSPFGAGIMTLTHGLTCDASGNLYAVAETQGRVVQFTPSLSGWTVGHTYTGLTQPDAVTIGPDGGLYVADYGSNKVVRFDTSVSGTGTPFITGLSGPVGVSFVTPEPATLTLLALGGLAVLRRRRK